MTQRFYLHDATTGIAGTLPGATALGNSGFGGPAVTATGAATNRTMDGTIGAGQTSAALTTNAVTSSQKNWFRRFLSPALAAQTLPASGTCSVSWGASEANANSDMFEAGSFWLGVWRPTTGAQVGSGYIDGSNASPTVTSALTEPGTTQSVCTASITILGGVTIQDGDILVLEVWSSQSQAMATAYTNTFFYDGTTEGSTTNVASYIDFGSDIPLLAVADNPPPPSPYIQLLAQ